ncbi:MAG: histidine phosphotransferase family protein [Rickettsiales bacterium]
MINETKLAEMLCTRLCHDLTGPIGAVNNGAEFLAEEGFDMQNEAMQLILNSANEAVNRLQFYRQAYGRVGETGEASLSDKKQLAEAFFASTKVKLDWPDAHTDASGVAVTQKMGKLILNLLIIAGNALIKGGTLAVRVSQSDAGEKEIRLSAKGDMVKLDAELVAILKGQGDEGMLSPKTSQQLLAMNLVEEIGAKLAFEASSDALELVCRQQALVTA